MTVVWLMLAPTGCDRTATYSAVLKEQLDAQRELTEVLASVKDAETMKSAKLELNKRFSRLEQMRKKAQGLSKPSQAIREKLQEEFGQDIQQTLADLRREAQRIEELPGGKEFVARLKQLR